MVMFHSYVSLPEGNIPIFRILTLLNLQGDSDLYQLGVRGGVVAFFGGVQVTWLVVDLPL